MIERLDGIVERTHPVDETAFHSLSAGDHSPHISCHFLGVHHHPFQRLLWDAAVGGDEPGDALLDLFKINGSLRHTQHQPVGAHRVYRHGGGGNNKRDIGAHCQGNADGVTAAHHQGDGGRVHSGDHFCNGESSLHIAAHGVEQDEQSLDLPILLNGDQRRENVFILGGLGVLRQDVVSLYLSDDVQTVDEVPGVLRPDTAGLFDQLCLIQLFLGAAFGCAVVLSGHSGTPLDGSGVFPVSLSRNAVVIQKEGSTAFYFYIIADFVEKSR